MKVILIDDEDSARHTLRNMLTIYFHDVEIIGEASTTADGVKLLEETKPDIVFLDVEMQFGTGFDLLDKFPDISFHVVFISAHSEYALQSYRFEAIDYLLKPIRIKELGQAIEKVVVKMVQADKTTKFAQVRTESLKQQKTQLIVPEVTGFAILRLSEILRCEGSRSYTIFNLECGQIITASKTLKEFESLLITHGFMRIHKSHMINLYRLKRYIRGRGGEVEMEDGTLLPVSRDRKDGLLDHFLGLDANLD